MRDGRAGARIVFGFVAMAGVVAAASSAPQSSAPSGVLSRVAASGRAQALAHLGGEMFVDPSLSASGRLSCATCHDPARAFASSSARPVQLGGRDLTMPGHRAVPSLMYLQATPPFTEHFFDSPDDGDGSVDNGPTGGLTWDGRVDRPRDQARIPLLSPFEMANRTAADVMAHVARASYAAEFSVIFGGALDAEAGLAAVTLALETYQQDARTFYPYSSKYDAYLAGRASLSPAEARGLRAFEDPARGNCAECHVSRRSPDGLPPQFTDYGFAALGVPRNMAIPANADPAYVDLGLCGPDRTDLAGRQEYCGLFMTPTLRNVATRRVFFHNGVFQSLRQAIEFYAERDVQPEKWYPRDRDGRIEKFNDLPARYWANVDAKPPFGGRPGARPALSRQAINDVVAFLGTLTDGFVAVHRDWETPVFLDIAALQNRNRN